jgi:hypothetical protein
MMIDEFIRMVVETPNEKLTDDVELKPPQKSARPPHPDTVSKAIHAGLFPAGATIKPMFRLRTDQRGKCQKHVPYGTRKCANRKRSPARPGRRDACPTFGQGRA